MKLWEKTDQNRMSRTLTPDFDEVFDVVVAGLGTAGAIALLTAAQRGLRVLGIERLNAMGGTGTLGYIMSYYGGSSGGAFEGYNRRTRDIQQALYADPGKPPHADAKAYVLEQAALEAGASFCYEAVVTGVYMEDRTVKGVRYLHKGRSRSVSARFVIDCTAEGAVCSLCGCAMQPNRVFDGQAQPYSNILLVLNPGGRLSPVNRDAGYIDMEDAWGASREMLSSHGDGHGYHMPYLVGTAPLMGVREGRRIVGEQILTLKDFLEGREPENPVFYAFSNLDNHSKDTAFESQQMADWHLGANLWHLFFSLAVPMGTLIPKGFDGLLTAGRMLAVDHDLAACVRMKSDMEKSGEAAAVLAALAIAGECPAISVDYDKLAAALKETGCLDEDNHVGLVYRGGEEKAGHWPRTPRDVLCELSGKHAGMGIWAASRMGAEVLPALYDALNSEDELLRRHAALALGMRGDAAALPLLRQMAGERDTVVNGGYFARMRGVSACYLLGRMGDEESIPLLHGIVETRGWVDPDRFTPSYLYDTPGDVRFGFVSAAVRALADIVGQHPEHREAVARVLHKALVRAKPDDYRIPLKFNRDIRYDMLEPLRRFAEAFFPLQNI